MIVLNSPDAAKFVLSTAHASFVHGYGMRRTELAGNGRFWGPGHAHFRKIVVAATTGENLHNILPFISRLAKRTVDSWEDVGVVNTCDEIRKVYSATQQVLIMFTCQPMWAKYLILGLSFGSSF